LFATRSALKSQYCRATDFTTDIVHKFETTLYQGLTVRPRDADPAAYDSWASNMGADSAKSFWRTYVYHLENPDEVSAGTAEPRVSEKGPYVYREDKSRFNVTFDDTNSSVSCEYHIYFACTPLPMLPPLRSLLFVDACIILFHQRFVALRHVVQSHDIHVKHEWQGFERD
jgi:hypothetical protein